MSRLLNGVVGGIVVVVLLVLLVLLTPGDDTGTVIGKKFVAEHTEKNYSAGMLLATALNKPEFGPLMAPDEVVPDKWYVIIRNSYDEQRCFEVTSDQFDRIRMGDHWGKKE